MKSTVRNLHTRLKQQLSRKIHFPRHVVILIVILIVAFDLRVESVTHSIVDIPIRGDASEYFLYGYNLKHFGTYSKSDTLFNKTQIPPIPDATRAPIYGMFVSLFLNDPPQDKDIAKITLAQAFISTAVVLIVFLIGRRIFPIPFALTATALTAISPHLVTANIYILSETLFGFTLVLAVYVVSKIMHHKSVAIPMLAGLALAAAALTHPMLLYFIVPATIFLAGYWGWKNGHKKVVLFLMGFCVLYGAWTTRNLISVGAPGDNHLMRIVMRTGIYPNLLYKDIPDTFPYPYHYDPDFKETSKDLASVLTELTRAFRETPAKELRWYLMGKPIMLYSWDLTEAYSVHQRGDVFTYPVLSTPYHYLPHFRMTHGFMYATHWVWVILMLGGIVIAWLPRERLGLSEKSVFVARFISLLLLYHTAVMVAGVPISRYSIPMRPFMYIMSILPIALAFNWYLKRQVVQPARVRLGQRRKKHPGKRRGGSDSRRAPAHVE
ncbi:MAG: glycosyltransferase family 39 protein [Proteobacteria bacterium]|nr:glycosyltransferase family 39 protein [Pseudomonadota bacterium]